MTKKTFAAHVKAAQMRLKKARYYKGRIDGLFGPLSEKAVLSLLEEADRLRDQLKATKALKRKSCLEVFLGS